MRHELNEPGALAAQKSEAPTQLMKRVPTWLWVTIGVLALIIGAILSPIFVVIWLLVLITGIVGIARKRRTWLRFPSRNVAIFVTTVAGIGLILSASIANAVLSGSARNDSVAVVGAPPSASTTPATPTPTPAVEIVEVREVIDGDTVDTSVGTVRLIGIDVPEVGQWGYSEARAELAAFVASGKVTLTAVEGRDDTDVDDRLLRYVDVAGVDAGIHMIESGWAIARYDSRDGHGAHPLEQEYFTLDAAHDSPTEPEPEPEPEPVVEPEPAPVVEPEPVITETDPQFRTCGEANDNGYGDYRSGVDPEYDWYQDRDHDGMVCER